MPASDGAGRRQANRRAKDDVAEPMHAIAHSRVSDKARGRQRGGADGPPKVLLQHARRRKRRGGMSRWEGMPAARWAPPVNGDLQAGGEYTVEDLHPNEITAHMCHQRLVGECTECPRTDRGAGQRRPVSADPANLRPR